MINIIKQSEFFPTIKIGDIIKINFNCLNIKNSKIESFTGKVLSIHKNEDKIFIKLYSYGLTISFNYICLLDSKIIKDIQIVKRQSYNKAKLYFFKS